MIVLSYMTRDEELWKAREGEREGLRNWFIIVISRVAGGA